MGELSRAGLALIDEIFCKFGRMCRSDLVDFFHELPEWQDPRGRAIPIEYHVILRAGGKAESEIAAVESEPETLAAAVAVSSPHKWGVAADSALPTSVHPFIRHDSTIFCGNAMMVGAQRCDHHGDAGLAVLGEVSGC